MATRKSTGTRKGKTSTPTTPATTTGRRGKRATGGTTGGKKTPEVKTGRRGPAARYNKRDEIFKQFMKGGKPDTLVNQVIKKFPDASEKDTRGCFKTFVNLCERAGLLVFDSKGNIVWNVKEYIIPLSDCEKCMIK